MKLLDRICRALLTDYELTLYELMESCDGSMKLDDYYMHMNHTELSAAGKVIIGRSRYKLKQRILHADLLQRIANGGRTAEEMEKEAYYSQKQQIDSTVAYSGTPGNSAVGNWPATWMYDPKVEGSNVAFDPVDVMAAYKKDSGNGY